MLKELPLRRHHHAYAVKDQEANRHFVEDILGIPLVATWCERTFRPEVGREVDYCHTFFEIADGGGFGPSFSSPTPMRTRKIVRSYRMSAAPGTWR